MTPVLILVGPPGAGKSTVGALLAARLGVGFLDVDAEIEAAAGRTIGDIFTTDGEETFRALERAAVARALAQAHGVVALGGGAVLAEQTRQRLAGHRVVFLAVGTTVGVRRTGLSSARPLLAGVNPRATFKALLDARLPLYRLVAGVEIDTDGRTPGEIVEELLEAVGAGR